ncbi:MAG: uracil-DNA glycosylase [Patescibacteria group bacterium]|nr:uracil-DNA glycosylase [Patescibacteria group bacterium]
MSNQEELIRLASEIKNCQKCPLYKAATNPVPGAPNPNAEIVFVGEAPGYWEDQKGIPFVGAAGNLLDKLLAKISVKRDDVFVCNILKHRPPNNRAPMPDEITACTPFLKRQLLTIKPKVVITLGRFAMNYFIPEAYISQTHGHPMSVNWEGLDLLIIPMYHPAAALRNGQVMKQLEEDFLKVPEIIEPRGLNLRYQSKRSVGAKILNQKTNSSTEKAHGFLGSRIKTNGQLVVKPAPPPEPEIEQGKLF